VNLTLPKSVSVNCDAKMLCYKSNLAKYDCITSPDRNMKYTSPKKCLVILSYALKTIS